MENSLGYLCAGFCDIANVAVPELRQQDDGIVAFSMTWRSVNVDVMVTPAISPDHAFVLFDMGTPDPGLGDPTHILLALMHANFIFLRAGQPVFSCHPETNAVVLQWTLPLCGSTPAGLHQVIQEGVALVLQWRESGFLPQAGNAGQISPATAAAAGSYV